MDDRHNFPIVLSGSAATDSPTDPSGADGWSRGRPTVGELWRTFRRGFSRRHLQCADARFVVAELPVDPLEVRRILPWGWRPTRRPLATLFLVDYRGPTFTAPYREAALQIHVRTPLGRGVHCCWIVVDDDTPMIYGRETLAYPKKMAQFTFEEDGDAIRVVVRRRGVDLITLHARRTARMTDPPPVFGIKTFNVGGIGQLLGFCPIWVSRLSETVREAHTLEMDLTIRDSIYDPIARLVTGDPERPRQVIEDIAGARYLFPAGVAGLRWYANTFFMRIR